MFKVFKKVFKFLVKLSIILITLCVIIYILDGVLSDYYSAYEETNDVSEETNDVSEETNDVSEETYDVDPIDGLILIDAGHGGKDPGATNSSQSMFEKDLTLKISMYQYKRFLDLGIPVALTRDQDVSLDMENRIQKIVKTRPEICISNHINAGGGDGCEIIYSINSSEVFSRKIEEEIGKQGQNVRNIYTKTSSDNTSKDYYYIHRKVKGVETVIVEYGFIDSPSDDVQQLRENWKAYAEAVVKAICEYKGLNYQTP